LAELLQVLTLMAAPATILLTVRYLIVRQNRMAAREPVGSQPPVRRA
jgi:hypothetical protein